MVAIEEYEGFSVYRRLKKDRDLLFIYFLILLFIFPFSLFSPAASRVTSLLLFLSLLSD